jgi:hypothetical protein
VPGPARDARSVRSPRALVRKAKHELARAGAGGSEANEATTIVN